LIIDCPADSLRAASLEVVFDDRSSDWGARISLTLWVAWLNAMAILIVILVALMMFPGGRRRLARRIASTIRRISLDVAFLQGTARPPLSSVGFPPRSSSGNTASGALPRVPDTRAAAARHCAQRRRVVRRVDHRIRIQKTGTVLTPFMTK